MKGVTGDAGDPSHTVAHRIDIAADHPAFDGHFPGRPVLPGVALLAEVVERVMADARLAAQVGAIPQLSVVKFLHPVEPGARLLVHFDKTARALRFSVRSADGAYEAATGQFDLVALAGASARASSPSA